MTKQISDTEIARRTQLAQTLSAKIDDQKLTQTKAAEIFREGIVWKSLKVNTQFKAISNKYLENDN